MSEPKQTPQTTSIVDQLQMKLTDLQRLYYGTKLEHNYPKNAPPAFPMIMFKVNELATRCNPPLKEEDKEKIADALLYLSFKKEPANNSLITELSNTARIATNFGNLLKYHGEHEDRIQHYSRGKEAFQQIKTQYTEARAMYASKETIAEPVKQESPDHPA